MSLRSRKAFFDTLWSRMAQQGDFPTLQFCVDNVFRSLNADLSVGEMASSVLSDFSLSQKVIRLANSAMYRSFGGEVTTVSRAILVLGVDAISHLSLGVQLIDYFAGSAPQRPQARLALKQAMLAGEITRSLAHSHGSHEGEEAVVCALMHNLSRLLLVFYCPDEWEAIQALCADGQITESEAVREVVGVTLEEIAEAAAVRWKLPAVITRSMTAPRLEEGSVLESHADWLGAIAQVSSRAAALTVAEADPEAVQAMLQSHAESLGLMESDVDAAVAHARNLNSSIAQSESERHSGAVSTDVGKPVDAAQRLRQGLQEIRREGATLSVSELAPLVLESAMRALNFSRCFLMLLNPVAKRFGARIGFGDGVREVLEQLSFEEGFVPDIFHFATIADKPLLVEDTQDSEVAHRVPRWYRDAIPDAKSVLLAPVKVRNRCVAVVCGDWGATRCPGGLSDAEIAAVGELTLEIAAGFLRTVERR